MDKWEKEMIENNKRVALETERINNEILQIPSYLTDEEKVMTCKMAVRAGADFVKTSTGFGTGGATMEDVLLMKANIGPDVKIKAAGGVSTIEDLENFLNAGCDRIGTSKAVALFKGEVAKGY